MITAPGISSQASQHHTLCNQDSRHPHAANAILPAPGRPIVTWLGYSTAEVSWVYPEYTTLGDRTYQINGFYLQIAIGDINDLKSVMYKDLNTRVHISGGLEVPKIYHWRVKTVAKCTLANETNLGLVESYFSPWMTILWDEAPPGPPGKPHVLQISYREVSPLRPFRLTRMY